MHLNRWSKENLRPIFVSGQQTYFRVRPTVSFSSDTDPSLYQLFPTVSSLSAFLQAFTDGAVVNWGSSVYVSSGLQKRGGDKCGKGKLNKSIANYRSFPTPVFPIMVTLHLNTATVSQNFQDNSGNLCANYWRQMCYYVRGQGIQEYSFKSKLDVYHDMFGAV